MSLYILLFTFLSFLFSLWLLKITIPYLIKNLIDKPNHRSSHELPKPSGGGLSFVISVVVMSLFNGNFIPMICGPLAFVGFLDDLMGLTRIFRFSTQLITVSLIILGAAIYDYFYDVCEFGY